VQELSIRIEYEHGEYEKWSPVCRQIAHAGKKPLTFALSLCSTHNADMALQQLSYNDRLLLVQHAILNFDTEQVLKEKLKNIMSQKELERSLDTLIATQKVRRIGNEKIQNNASHVGELPALPPALAELLQNL
jgi:poly-D-alanine transfer protein DltD